MFENQLANLGNYCLSSNTFRERVYDLGDYAVILQVATVDVKGYTVSVNISKKPSSNPELDVHEWLESLMTGILFPFGISGHRYECEYDGHLFTIYVGRDTNGFDLKFNVYKSSVLLEEENASWELGKQ